MGRGSLGLFWAPVVQLRCAWPDPVCRQAFAAEVCSFYTSWSFLLSLTRSWSLCSWFSLLFILTGDFTDPQRPAITHCQCDPDSGGPSAVLAFIKGSSLWESQSLSLNKNLAWGACGDFRVPSRSEDTIRSLSLYPTMWFPKIIASWP